MKSEGSLLCSLVPILTAENSAGAVHFSTSKYEDSFQIQMGEVNDNRIS
jgi:hypothetical protein